MNEKAAKALVVGSRVCWDHSTKDSGIVIEVGYNACKVKWDNITEGGGLVFFILLKWEILVN